MMKKKNYKENSERKKKNDTPIASIRQTHDEEKEL